MGCFVGAETENKKKFHCGAFGLAQLECFMFFFFQNVI